MQNTTFFLFSELFSLTPHPQHFYHPFFSPYHPPQLPAIVAIDHQLLCCSWIPWYSSVSLGCSVLVEEEGWSWENVFQIHSLLLLLSCFSRVRLCATRQRAAHQAPPSLGFSRQESWSGLPFPSPMHESEKWKGSRSVVSDSQRPHGLQPTRLLCPWDFPGKSTGVGCHCLLWIQT